MNFKWTQKEYVIFARIATGKTTMGKKYDNVKELTHSAYKYLDYDKNIAESIKGGFKITNPNYPIDLIIAIETEVKKGNLVLVNFEESIAKELKNREIKFICAYREDWLKIEELCIKRNNPKEFIEKKKLDYFEKTEKMKQHSCINIPVPNDKYLEDVLIEFENQNSSQKL
jgi:hypothetical protein